MKYKLVIFDIDGTIVDAYGAIRNSLNFARRKFGYRDVSMRTVKRSIGHGDKNFVAGFFKDDEVPEALELYRKHHERALVTDSRALPCAKQVLSRLRKKGCKLAVASNRPMKFSLILLKKLGLRKYFHRVECAGKKTELKPRPTLLLKTIKDFNVKRGQTLYVGDMAIDVRAGKNAGVDTVAILGGSASMTELKKERPFRIIKTLCEIPSIGEEA
jgi:phosphoglycolate phosphatase